MDEETNKLLKEILLDKFALDLTEDEVWIIEKYPLLLCHIVQGTPVEFEWKFRDDQTQHGTNLADATAKFSAKDTPITPIFTGKWKLI